MNTDRMLFYAAIIGMLCTTMMITHCSYQVTACKQNAIKAGVEPEKIQQLCRLN